MMMLPPHRKLEHELARWIGDEDPDCVVACSSGTAALHLAFEAMELPRGSTVLCPDLTMVACPRAISLAGLVPHFVDCRADDLLVDLDLLDDAAASGASAAMVVHLYGRRVGMDQVDVLALKHGFKVVEDMAEAHGIKPHQASDAACWSFYKNKVVHGEEGGAVWFRDRSHADLARKLRSLGFTDEHDFWHVPRGHNYRLADLLATPILRSLSMASEALYVRGEIVRTYDEQCPPEWRLPPRDCPWVYDLRIPGMTSEVQTRVVKAVQEAGVAARHCFKPCSRLREYRGAQITMEARSQADRASREVVYLPVTLGDGCERRIPGAFDAIRQALAET